MLTINRNNYEEFFLLYADNELSIADRETVERFISNNEDLRNELQLLLQTQLMPEKTVAFTDKDILLKPLTKGTYINAINFEQFFVQYVDNELTASEMEAVEKFIYDNPQHQQEFELIQKARLSPDSNMVFPHKESLYRKSETAKLFTFNWRYMAAAAIVLLGVGIFWLINIKEANNTFARIEENVDSKVANTITGAEPGKNTIVDVSNNTIAIVKETKKEILPVTKNTVKPYSLRQPGNNKTTIAKEMTVYQRAAQESKTSAKTNNELDKILHPAIVSNPGITATLQTIEMATTLKEDVPEVVIAKTTEYLNPEEKTLNGSSYSANTDSENLNLLNLTVSKKNGLRGIFRKTSRSVAKVTKLGNNQDGHSRSILIGGFEITAN
jgi:hypothetical protein